MEKIDEYKQRYAKLFPELNERQRRLVAAADAMALGYGGIEVIHQASKLARNTLRKGIRELEEGEHLPDGRCRKAGGGSKRASEKDKTLEEDLLLCIKPATKGDPMSALLWVSKSSRKIQGLLKKQGHQISHTSVRTLLQRNGYTLQSNRKAQEEKTMREEERDQQFHYISRLAGSYLKGKSPVISSDTKKKELVGNYKNGGRTWQISKRPIEVNRHDFPDKTLGKAIPYGVYDLAMNKGYVMVGITHDTAEFAVASIENWWEHLGKEQYPAATKLLITVDAGGSNGQ